MPTDWPACNLKGENEDAKSPPHLLKPIKVGKFILKNRMQSSNSMPHFSGP